MIYCTAFITSINRYKYIDPNGKLAFLAVVPWAASAIKASLFVGSAGVVGYGASQVYQAHSNTPDNWIYNSDSETPDNDEGDQVEKPLPEGLVGDQSHPNAGKKKKSTKRWTSGPLLPEHGGVSGTNPDSNADSDSWEDFLTLTGGNYDPEPTENGMIVGGNGIRYRPSTETHAPGIEIPAN